jgi:glycosyltransferase involved in cell wall biosynthesis
VSWWFAYTNGTADYLVDKGAERDTITVVQNAVDTKGLRDAVVSISDAEAAAVRAKMNIPEEAPVGLYLGILEDVKEVPALIEAARIVKQAIPNFHLIVAGAGTERPKIEEAAANSEWIHYVGPAFGRDKAMYSRISSAFLLYGRVGLAVLDAFGGGLPLIATELEHHGPEIEYLQNGYNGMMTPHDIKTYAAAVTRLLSDKAEMERLRAGAIESGERYTIEAMVENFRQGVLKALNN